MWPHAFVTDCNVDRTPSWVSPNTAPRVRKRLYMNPTKFTSLALLLISHITNAVDIVGIDIFSLLCFYSFVSMWIS